MDAGDYCEAIPLTTPIDSIDYNMCHKYRGVCLILDNENFSPDHSSTRTLTRRVGSQVDTEALSNLMEKLGFDVVVRRDSNLAGIKEILKQIAMLDHSENDCFACFVLTHGEHGKLFAYDGRYANEHLFSNFWGNQCPTLVGKPKLFFIQACQGSRLDRGINVAADAIDAAYYFKIPTYADFMIAYSTLPGFYSFRNTEKGSWFVRSLVEIIGEYHLEYDLLSMMTMVSHRIAYYYSSNAADPSQTGMKQIPCVTSMLTRRVFLQPKIVHI